MTAMSKPRTETERAWAQRCARGIARLRAAAEEDRGRAYRYQCGHEGEGVCDKCWEHGSDA